MTNSRATPSSSSESEEANTIQQGRIKRSPGGKIATMLSAAAVTTLDGLAESSMVYQPLHDMVGLIISRPHFLKHLIPTSLALTNFIAEFSSSNQTIRNTLISFAVAIREGNFNKKSSAAFAAGILATMPEAFFTATAIGEASDELSDDHSNISNILSVSRYPILAGLCLAHAIVYSAPIKELHETINQIYSSLSTKSLVNYSIATLFLALVSFRIYKFSATELAEARDFFGTESQIPPIATTASLVGFAPLNFVAAAKAAQSLFQKQSHTHTELIEDPETQKNTNITDVTNGHTHQNNDDDHEGGCFHNTLFCFGAMISTIPVMNRDFRQDGLTTWTAIQAVLLAIGAFIVFKYIHNNGHENEHVTEPGTSPRPIDTPKSTQVLVSNANGIRT
jgi:hypothetical protein